MDTEYSGDKGSFLLPLRKAVNYYVELSSDEEKTKFLEAWTAGGPQQMTNHSDRVLIIGQQHKQKELRRMTGILLAGGVCILCGESHESLDQAHVKRNRHSTGFFSGTYGLGGLPQRQTLKRSQLISAMNEGEVAMLCINCHRS
jgi:hypothetical protein